MSIREKLNAKMKDAMRNKDQIALSTIRLINAAIKDRDISERSSGHAEGISENDILSLLQSMIKQRNESVKIYRESKREDLAEREEEEIKIISEFLPKQMDDGEVENIVVSLIKEVKAESIKDMGKVMAEIKRRYAGQVDMTKASGVVKQKLVG